MTGRVNNPRGPFREVVQLSVWRTEYDANGRASLFVDASFKEGRIGDDSDAPIRFRLRIRRAEVHVHPDAAKVLKVVSSTVKRESPTVGGKTSAISKKDSTTASVGGKLSSNLGDINVNGEVGSTYELSTARQFTEEVSRIAFQVWDEDDGSVRFILEPGDAGSALKSRAWDRNEPRLAFKDTAHPRAGSEPPEPLVRVTCAIEDLEITDIQYKIRFRDYFIRMPDTKKVAVIAYIKNELRSHGVDFVQGEGPFARMIIADASARVGEDDEA